MPRPTFRRRTAPLSPPDARSCRALASRRGAAVWRCGVLALIAGASLTACGGTDPFAPKATLDTTLDTLQVYALSTAPSQLPTALSLYASQTVRPAVRSTLTLNFDVAVDVDAAGRVRFLPPKLLVAAQSAALATGMQVVANTTFDALTSAPKSGYQYDSVTVAAVGQVVAVQTQGAGPLGPFCTTTTPMYAKLVVDSVRPVSGTQLVYLRARIDANCGFRSFEPGLPSS